MISIEKVVLGAQLSALTHARALYCAIPHLAEVGNEYMSTTFSRSSRLNLLTCLSISSMSFLVFFSLHFILLQTSMSNVANAIKYFSKELN